MKVSKRNLYSFLHILLVVLVIGLSAHLLSLIVANNESITDARNYFYFYNLFVSGDIASFFFRLASETGKLEPVIYLWVYSLFGSSIVDMQTFAFACTFIVMALLGFFARLVAVTDGVEGKQLTWFVIGSLFIFLLWYPSYSSVLWVWRSHLSFTIVLIAFIIRRPRWTVALLPVAFFLHYSGVALFFVVVCLDFFFRRIGGISRGVKFLLVFVVGAVASLLVGYIKRAIVSGDGDWSSETNAGIYVYIYVALFSILMVTIYNYQFARSRYSFFASSLLNCFFAITFFFIGLSLTSSSSHQDLMRIMQPVFIVLPISFVLIWMRASLLLKLLMLFMLGPGVLMGVRSIISYLT